MKKWLSLLLTVSLISTLCGADAFAAPVRAPLNSNFALPIATSALVNRAIAFRFTPWSLSLGRQLRSWSSSWENWLDLVRGAAFVGSAVAIAAHDGGVTRENGPRIIWTGFLLSMAIQHAGIWIVNKLTLGTLRLAEVALNCGNVVIIADQSISFSDLFRLLRQMIWVTDVRGRQTGGLVTFLAKGDSQVGVRSKVKPPKRFSLPFTMVGVFRGVVVAARLLAFMTFNILRWPAVRIFHGHVRFGTSSRPKRKESHPHQFVKPRLATVVEVVNGKLVSVKKRVENFISHNGDFDEDEDPLEAALRDKEPMVELYGKPVSHGDIGRWLERVFHIPNPLRGDSPKIAGLIDLLHTQGQWGASARLAFQLTVADSLSEEPLTEAQVAEFGNVLQDVFDANAKELLSAGGTSLADVDPIALERLKANFAYVLGSHKTLGPLLKGREREFIDSATDAFFDNDLYVATHKFMRRAIGSFGFIASSSLKTDGVVISARKQPLSVGLRKDGRLVAIGSEAAALKLGAFDYRFNLDIRGETAEVGIRNKKVYLNVYPERKPSSLREALLVEPLSQEEILATRLEDLHDNPLIDPLPPPPGPDSVQSDINVIPSVLSTVRESMDRSKTYDINDPKGFNLQTVDDFNRFFLAKTLKKVILMGIPIKHHKPMLMDRINDDAELLANGLYARTLHPEDLRAMILALEKKYTDWIAADPPELRAESPLPEEPIDVLVLGYEKSLWAAEQFADNVGRLFGNMRLFKFRADSSNKILRALKDQQKRDDFQLHIPGGILNRQTLVIAVSDGGQNFPTVNATNELIEKLELAEGNRVFVVSSELDTPLGALTGQKYVKGSKFARRIFRTMSGRRSTEPASVSVVATNALFAEILLALAQDLHYYLPNGNGPLGLRLDTEKINEIYRRRDHTIDTVAPQTTARDAAGNLIDSPTYRSIKRDALRRALDIWDVWVGRAYSIIYIYFTVRRGMPTVGHFLYTVLPQSIHPFHFPAWLMGQGTFDWLWYVFGPYLVVYAWRLVTCRQVLSRVANRKFFILDVPYVYQPLELFLSKLFSMAFGGFGIQVEGGNPQDHAAARLGHRAVRGDLIDTGLPNEKLPALKNAHNGAKLTTKQLYGGETLGANVITGTVGSGGEKDGMFQDHLPLPPYAHIPQDRTVQILFESLYDSMDRQIARFVRYHQIARYVTLKNLLWDTSRTQSGAKHFSTASPESGAQTKIWDWMILQGWISEPWARRFAFTEELLFTGVFLVLPLALLPNSHDIGVRIILVLLGSTIFGLSHSRTPLRFMVLGLVFRAAFLFGASDPHAFLITLGLHFAWNNILLPLFGKTPETPAEIPSIEMPDTAGDAPTPFVVDPTRRRNPEAALNVPLPAFAAPEVAPVVAAPATRRTAPRMPRLRPAFAALIIVGLSGVSLLVTHYDQDLKKWTLAALFVMALSAGAAFSKIFVPRRHTRDLRAGA